MIRKLTVKGFQRHQKLELELSRVTTIVGPSDVGKSALLRALEWALLNRPRGLDMLRQGSKQVSVKVELDKHELTRIRGKRNLYRLDGRTFAAFGHDVPQEIQAVANVADVNFQGQHDPPFWFTLPAAEVSKRLNAIVDLTLIDTTLANLAKGKRDTRAELAVVDRRLEQAQASVRGLKKFSRIDRRLKRVQALWDRWQRYALRRDGLDALVQGATQHQLEAQRLATATPSVQGLEARADLWKGMEQSYRELAEAILGVEMAQEDKNRLRAQCLHDVEKFSQELGKVCALCGQAVSGKLGKASAP